jgi:hypothetical protein
LDDAIRQVFDLKLFNAELPTVKTGTKLAAVREQTEQFLRSMEIGGTPSDGTADQ